MSISFEVMNTDGLARRGQIKTAHSTIQTPVFMPVGTGASVKAMFPESLLDMDYQIILGNTYHLMLSPGPTTVEQFGGLHKFMNWPRSILTDSGGFQAMSLRKINKINEDGIIFSSHKDGAKYFLDPATSIGIQHKLNSNITMILDECTPHGASDQYTKESMLRSLRWAKLSKQAFVKREGFGLFGITQGGFNKALRYQSTSDLINMEFDGYAVGGLAIGEEKDIMLDILAYNTDLLPQNKPRYLMGVGKPSDIINAVALGVDMFDCVIPTREARKGRIYTSQGEINIRNAKHKTSTLSIDEHCTCYTCKNYSLAYLRHLFKNKEMLASMLMTLHNLFYYQQFMKQIRSSIAANSFSELHKKVIEELKPKV